MNDWIEWKDGKCPVDAHVKVQVVTRSGANEVNKASAFIWSNDASPHDIVRYRVLGQPECQSSESNPDMVNAPPHYQLLPGVDVISVRDAIFEKIPAGTTYDVVDCWSRSWEYLTRMWGKNQLEDAKKARFYLDRMIEKMEQNK